MLICYIERQKELEAIAMIAMPSDIMSRFQLFLDRTPVPKQLQTHYKKWFRYYWDFCHKYDREHSHFLTMS